MNNRKLDAKFYGPRLIDVYVEIRYRVGNNTVTGTDYVEADVPRGIVPTTEGNMVPMDAYYRPLGRN